MRFIVICLCFTSIDASLRNTFFNNEVNQTPNSESLNIQNHMSDSSIIRELVQRMESLEARDKSLVQEIHGLKQELANQKTKIAILQQKNDKQDRLISRIMERLLRPKDVSVASQIKDNTLPEEKFSQNFEKKGISSKNRIQRSENEVTVAFTVGLTQRMQHIGAHQNIIFDHVETNIGNGYNPHHGVFTAPVDGIYVFYTSVLADNNREIWCQLVVNGQNKADAYARGTDGRHDQGSQAIIVQLQQGDDVAVQNVAADDSIYGDAGIYTTFSGFLFQQDFPQNGAIVG